MGALPIPQQPASNDPNHPRPPASIDGLARQLRPVVRTGADRAKLRERKELLALRCVRLRARSRAYPDTDDGRTLALRDVLHDALAALGDGPYGTAARLLFGATPGTRGRPLADRRRLAADALDLLPSTFRKNYEAELILDVAAEIYRAEIHPK